METDERAKEETTDPQLRMGSAGAAPIAAAAHCLCRSLTYHSHLRHGLRITPTCGMAYASLPPVEWLTYHFHLRNGWPYHHGYCSLENKDYASQKKECVQEGKVP
mmetsp:Transcript_3416/g.9108  ORF Transcript_3416/g.9108 Transcript_3416/m.9108 type:complete len:105 (+) Transcript_3416:1190-1504(+)|eukprot:1139344-Pelagomonas_calceolata.AAC.3